jgi:hypothetical protein
MRLWDILIANGFSENILTELCFLILTAFKRQVIHSRDTTAVVKILKNGKL